METKRERFEEWLKRKPEAMYWNTTDAMFAAWCGGAATSTDRLEPVAWAVLSTHSGDEEEVDLFEGRKEAEHYAEQNGGVVVPLVTPNVPHEGRQAGSSPGVPLDAVVGGAVTTKKGL